MNRESSTGLRGVLRGFFTTVGVTFVVGCAQNAVNVKSVTPQDPKVLLQQACEPGKSVQKVKGSVWLKAKSTEASGQFPAMVEAEEPGHLRMEVTNLLGGTEAIISVEGRAFTIDVPHHQGRNQKGTNSWGGIPLEWANSLFLGRVPCPSAASLSEATVEVTKEGDLVVNTKPSLEREAERYVYGFRSWSGQPWAESLHWERKSELALSVDFKFDDPEDHTRSPRKWEAKSSQGEVKVRWKNRDLLR